jgi:dTDP-4-dehydrorhamnose reductase
MRIVLTGSRGLLGREIVAAARPHQEVVGLDLDEFDATDPMSAREAIIVARPDVVIHAAAWTDVDGCESEPDRAMKVNAIGAKNVALAAREADAWLVALSTDYVFDGEKGEAYDESDPPAPLGAYGRSKRLGERFVETIAPRHTIIRTQALFGEGGRNFVDTILAAAKRGGPLRIVADQATCPTFAPHLATEILRILEEGTEGLYHVSARGVCTWLDLAEAALSLTGRTDIRVEPITTEELARPAPRPRYGALRNMHLELTIGDGMPHWRDGLREHLAGREEAT